MKITLGKIVLCLFGLFILTDIASTFMVMQKHGGTDWEVNPLAVIGVPLWALIILKFAAATGVLWWFLHKYGVNMIHFRYFMVFFLCLTVMLSLAMTLNNLKWFNTPIEEIQPLPKEERIPQYTKAVMDLQIVEETMEEITPFKVPLMFTLFVFNFIVFCVWVSFEKEWGLI